MCSDFLLKALSVALLLFVLPLAVQADPHRFRCPADHAEVTFSEPVNVALVCQAVADARSFLESHDLDVGGSIKIHIVEVLPNNNWMHMLGYYDHTDEQIYVLNFTQCVKNKVEMFNLPINQDLYRSFLVHETAHAIASRNFSVKQTLTPHEYIAYVTQLSTMPLGLRSKILARFPDEGFSGLAQINPIYFLLSPELFAVKAYRHFQQHNDPAALLHWLLEEEFSIDPYP